MSCNVLSIKHLVCLSVVGYVVGFPMAAPPRPVAPNVNAAIFPDMQSGTASVVRLLLCVCTCVCVCMCLCLCARACMCMCVYVRGYVCVCVCVSLCLCV